MAIVDIDRASTGAGIPDDAFITRCATAALDAANSDAEISLRIVDAAESAGLNAQYRHKQGPTNVLSFPCELPDVVESTLLGDIVICAPVVAEEALQQNKLLPAHWAHMVVHGVLHLQGYDHVEASAADIMEAREVAILGELGFPDPYNEPNRT